MPEADAGAYPLQKLVELDSAAHHIREDLDRGRQEQASTNVTLRQQLEGLDVRVRAHGEQLAGISSSIRTVMWMIATVVPAAVGAAWTLARFVR